MLTGPLDGIQDKTIYTDYANGELQTITQPIIGATTYIYDDAGNMITMTDVNGIETVYA